MKNKPSHHSIISFDELYRTLSDQAGDAIFILGLDGKIIYANAAVKDVAQYLPSDYIGKHFKNFVAQDSLPRAKDFFNKVLQEKMIVRGEISVFNRAQEIIPVEFTLSPIFRNKRLIQVHAIVRNILHKKNQENSIRAIEKLKTVQHFIAGTVEEVQFPLRAIYENLDALLEKYQDKDFEYISYKEFKSILNSLMLTRSQVQKCFETLQKLMMINKKKLIGQSSVSDVNKVIKEVCALFEHEILAKDVRLTLKLSSHIPEGFISPLEFNQVIVNILNNSIQAVTYKGEISISTSYKIKEKKIFIECKDNGKGISKEALKHIFEPFFTTKKNEKESAVGLGLSIVYAILQSYQAEIAIQSNLKKGTAVNILLQAAKK